MSTTPSDLLSESLIRLHEVARRLPPHRGGRPVSFSCVLRWITKGIPGPDGQRVKLEAVRVGSRWLTSTEAIARWSERLTPRLEDEQPQMARTLTQQSKGSMRAAKLLERAGI
jgi:hypothetical protein